MGWRRGQQHPPEVQQIPRTGWLSTQLGAALQSRTWDHHKTTSGSRVPFEIASFGLAQVLRFLTRRNVSSPLSLRQHIFGTGGLPLRPIPAGRTKLLVHYRVLNLPAWGDRAQLWGRVTLGILHTQPCAPQNAPCGSGASRWSIFWPPRVSKAGSR